MVADVASAKACEMMRGQFRPLRAADRPEVVTGVLWIRDCTITNHDTHVRMQLGGVGWQWAHQEKKQAGAHFVVNQYVKFGVHATIDGTLDLAFDRRDHVLSFWFTPAHAPEIAFDPIGGVAVQRKGLWSKVIGAIGSADKKGAKQAKQQGTQQFVEQLGRGLAVAIDLCSGYQRFTIGRPTKGSLGPPDAGETPKVPIELAPNALFVFGPELDPHGMSIDVDTDGPVDVALVCADNAEELADAYAHGRAAPPRLALAGKVVTGHARLHTPARTCKVAVVARSVAPKTVHMDWKRPAGEQARSTGGPVLRCMR